MLERNEVRTINGIEYINVSHVREVHYKGKTTTTPRIAKIIAFYDVYYNGDEGMGGLIEKIKYSSNNNEQGSILFHRTIKEYTIP